jgi:hypothetical protein
MRQHSSEIGVEDGPRLIVIRSGLRLINQDFARIGYEARIGDVSVNLV